MERTFEEEVLCRLTSIESAIASRAELCDIHKADLHSVKKDIEGNGKKGLKQELIDLKQEFIKFETKVLTYATIGSSIGGALVTFVVRKLSN